MFRDGGTIYVNGEQYTRIPKSSETIKNIQEEISRLKFFLKHAKFATEKELVAKHKRLGKLERELSNLSESPRCHKTIKTYKKMSPKKIRAYVLQRIEEYKKENAIYISAENIAFELKVKPHFVHQVFQKLNIEGVLSQPRHHIPHDSDRDPWCNGTYSGWQSDVYAIHYDMEEEENES